MRVFALLSFTNLLVEILILTISLQSVADAKNSQVQVAKTTKVPDAARYKVRISSKYNGEGKLQYIQNMTVCTNVQQELHRRILSLKVYEGCARFYTHEDCNGKFIEVMDTDPFQGNLTKWDFHLLTYSVGPCPGECSMPGIGRNVPNPEMYVYVFPENSCKGGPLYLKVEGCTKIPEKVVGPNMSVYHAGGCIEMYNNTDCSRLPGTSAQLRPGNPHTCQLSQWKVKNFQSMSLCNFHCAHGNASNNTMTSTTTTRTTTTSTENPGTSSEASTKGTTELNISSPSMPENATTIEARAGSDKYPNSDNVTKEVDHRINLQDSNRKGSGDQPSNLYFPFITLVLFIIIGFLVLYMFVLFRIKPITQIAY